jgi:glycosyltransferase involved in cell wall biosynthesis
MSNTATSELKMKKHSEDGSLKILGIVPSGYCFGLQNLTLDFFARLPPAVTSYFLTTRWTDGEFGRRLDGLRVPYSSTWLGMFSRNLDRRNLKMTVACLLKLPVAWWDFLRLYQFFRPDVIYLANYHEVILLWPLLFWLRQRVVCHMHDPPPAVAFQRVSFFVWRSAVGRFVCVSESVRERLARLGPLSGADAVIHNGVAIRELDLPRRRASHLRERFNWPEGAVIFGITGQVSPAKGHTDFVEAAALAARDNPDLRFVVGGKSNEFLERLKDKVKDLGLNDSFGFCGWLPSASDFYQAIDVLVMPSRQEEGFGLVVAEAGERGIPVIATRTGVAAEVVIDGETGLLVAKQDPAALGSSMALLGNNSHLRNMMGARGRERVCRMFERDKQVEKFFRFLANRDREC